MNRLNFENIEYFYLLLLLLPIIAWYVLWSIKKQASITISTLKPFKSMGKKPLKPYLRHIPFAFRMMALALLIFVLARPQSTDRWQDVTTEGIDIVIALDISTSMEAMDFKPNRLEAAKDVATQFISGRPDDRMGLVVFAGESFTQCPLTTDHAVLINLFKDVKTRIIEDGTAIGSGLATAVNRLKTSDAKSKVIILLTDGENNSGAIAPATAAEIAKKFNIRVYTIGVGTKGTAPITTQSVFGPVVQQMPVSIDEDLLKSIAAKTNGKYFRATNKESLAAIYQEIDQLEKSKIDVKHHKKVNEEFFVFLFVAGMLLLMEWLLRYTVFRTVP